MSYHPRIETAALASFITTRSRNSELWFINNRPLEEAILGYVANFAERYGVEMYAFAIEGNHTHCPALFPHLNRASFMRDLNSCIARAVKRLVPEFQGGRFWGRRYSAEFLPSAEDIEEYFFYSVLQPVNDGLVERLSDYPGYNCFRDAIWGVERKFKVVKWSAYNAAKRFNKSVKIDDYIQEFSLRYARLPGYEKLSQAEYAKIMMHKLEVRRRQIVAERYRRGLSFMGRSRLLSTARGSLPVLTKTSSRSDRRPRILSVNAERRRFYRAWYLGILNQYRAASARFRQGDRKIRFPAGTFLPCILDDLPEPVPKNCSSEGSSVKGF